MEDHPIARAAFDASPAEIRLKQRRREWLALPKALKKVAPCIRCGQRPGIKGPNVSTVVRKFNWQRQNTDKGSLNIKPIVPVGKTTSRKRTDPFRRRLSGRRATCLELIACSELMSQARRSRDFYGVGSFQSSDSDSGWALGLPSNSYPSR